MHLILATQKPAGVVNDQIEANSTSKIALKMASEQDSNELLKTADAAHITNPGRGYLKVGQNEVYELFQSGYAGLPYDPDAVVTERVDERIYKINEVGQYELFYDPDEEVEQGKDTSDLPTQLEAVIDSIASLFDGDAGLMLPDKPWLPGLAEAIPSPEPRGAGAGVDAGYAVPLGMLDIPSRQAQENYDFDLVKAGHTVVFGSPGYGKSAILQTMVMNLSKARTPEQLHIYLLDFGNNGLLPLKGLPNVADIVTPEEGEKLDKMLGVISETLAVRKQLFKEAGVANLEQYGMKTKQALPVVLNVLDGYDNLTPNDPRKDGIDNVLLQVLREGAAVGVYLVLSSSRVGGVRMSMLSNISTKICLFLNDEGELGQIMGRERLEQSGTPGRGQIQIDVPTAIQFYLPAHGENSGEILAAMEAQVAELDDAWVGERPARIPMVPQELTTEIFAGFVPAALPRELVPYGLDRASAEVAVFPVFSGRALGVFAESGKQARLLFPFFAGQVASTVDESELVVIDAHDAFVGMFTSSDSLFVGKAALKEQGDAVKEALLRFVEHGAPGRRCLLISGLSDLIERLTLLPDQVAELLALGNDRVQVVVFDHVAKVNSAYGLVASLREYVDTVLFGGDFGTQRFVENVPFELRKESFGRDVLHSLRDGELTHVVVPSVGEREVE
ncbi:FtsK/SpoIIIE domain-containing protein [Leucobacter insecticola]|uniref:FtsK/SpoIIIE domain-containing protein n=1 Tax=Leucobacter insecticola TaxID=2714934 RepID=UPI00197D4626|nr:FtsK/SpoIIIE domain-containing protein [Leucobacter insecticola]